MVYLPSAPALYTSMLKIELLLPAGIFRNMFLDYGIECSVPPLLQSAQYSLPSESENPARKLLFHFHNNMAYKGYLKSTAAERTVL